MAKIIDDTVMYKEIVKDFDSCVKKYKEIVDSFFTDIANIKSWEGNATVEYLERTLVEKNKCVEFGESLSKFVDTLDNVGTEIDNAVSSIGG